MLQWSHTNTACRQISDSNQCCMPLNVACSQPALQLDQHLYNLHHVPISCFHMFKCHFYNLLANKYITVDAKGDRKRQNPQCHVSTIPRKRVHHNCTHLALIHMSIRTHNNVHRTLPISHIHAQNQINSLISCEGNRMHMHPEVAAVAAQIGVQQSKVCCPIGYPPSGKDRHIDANAALTWHKEWRLCLLCL